MPVPKRVNKSTQPAWQKIVIVGIAIIVVSSVAIYLALSSMGGISPTESPSLDANRDDSDSVAQYAFVANPALHSGNPNAPVTITLFEDFHCSACAYLNRVTMVEIAERFVATGQVKIEFRHFVHYGDDSLAAAEAAECVNEQDVKYGSNRFREFHDLLFANQHQQLEPSLLDFASQIGVRDLPAFQNCLKSGKYIEKIRQSTSWIVNQGARGTPAIIAGDELYVGVPTMAALEQAIAAKLQ